MSGPSNRPDSFYEADQDSFFGRVKQKLIDAEQSVFDWQDENLRQKGFSNTTDKYLQEQQAREPQPAAVGVLDAPVQPSKEMEQFPYSPLLPPNSSEEVVKEGGEAAPPPGATPAQQIGVMNFNRTQGFAGSVGMPERPKPPTPRETTDRIVQQESKQVLFDQTKIPKWHESTSFYNGLLAMGLNLMAGNDIATAFNQGAQVFQQNFGVEKRSQWANDLREAGYDDLEIMKYIETGDNKVLTDPMEKQRRARQDALAEAQLRKAEWESDPARLAYKDDVEDYKLRQEDAQQQFANKLALSQHQLAIHNANRTSANADLERQLKQLQIQKAQKELDKINGAGKPDPKMFMSGALMGGVNFDDLLYSPSWWDQAKLAGIEKRVSKAGQEAAKQQWTPEFHAWNQARNQASEMIGRALSGAALSETNERPTWANALLPTQKEIDDNNVASLNRKRAVFNALKVYSSSIAEGGQGSLSLNDVELLGKGGAEFQVDEYGIPRAILYKNGTLRYL